MALRTLEWGESVESNYETAEKTRPTLPKMEGDKWIVNSFFDDVSGVRMRAVFSNGQGFPGAVVASRIVRYSFAKPSVPIQCSVIAARFRLYVRVTLYSLPLRIFSTYSPVYQGWISETYAAFTMTER